MARIVTKGFDWNQKPRSGIQGDCYRCKTRYETQDVEEECKTTFQLVDGQEVFGWEVPCPNCGAMNFFPAPLDMQPTQLPPLPHAMK